MTIHDGHPFHPPEGERLPVRRLRGRLPSPVAIVATGMGNGRVGLTVSSFLIVDGNPGRVILMLDPLSDVAGTLEPGSGCTVNLLSPGHELLAEVFAGLAPAPGGPFTEGQWADGSHGPELAGAAALACCRVDVVASADTGWSRRYEAVIEQTELTELTILRHERGRYV